MVMLLMHGALIQLDLHHERNLLLFLHFIQINGKFFIFIILTHKLNNKQLNNNNKKNRWRKFFINIYQYEWGRRFQRPLSLFLCRRWASTHHTPPQSKLRSIRVLFLNHSNNNNNNIDNTNTKDTEPLWLHDCT